MWRLTEEQIEAAFAALAQGPIVAPPQDEPLARDLPRLVRLANLRIDRELRRMAAELGHPSLSSTAVLALRLCRYNGKPNAALAELLLISRQAVGQLVAALEQSGLVERSPGRSGLVVTLTEAGREAARDLDAAFDELAEHWELELRDGRLDQLSTDIEVLSAMSRRERG